MKDKSKGFKKVTIDDIAREAGVSKATVSRYINKKQGAMSEETEKRISDVIKEHNYRPNRNAQSLKAEYSNTIGCVIADITNPFYTQVLKGLNDVCVQYGYQLLFVNTDNNSDYERSSILSLLDNRLDGIAVNTTGENDDLLMEIHDSGIPVVMADRYLDGDQKLDIVTSTNYESTVECIEHILEEGYDEVYCVSDKIGYNRNRTKRESAFVDVMSKTSDKNYTDNIYFNTHTDPELRQLYLDQFVASIVNKHKGENICFFSVNGYMTSSLIQTTHNLNYKIGCDYGLASYDEVALSALLDPGITSIEQDNYSLGYKVAKQLIYRIENKDKDYMPEFIRLDTNLNKRGSTKING